MTKLAEIQSKVAALTGQPEVTVVAVSKTKPDEAIMNLYQEGQRIFGENRVQELVGKEERLPMDIQWHMIGHLQRNKVKYIAPFVSMIHAVDSPRLAEEISKQAARHERRIPVLLQVHIAEESAKFGFSPEELYHWLSTKPLLDLPGIEVHGLMGMATFTDNMDQVRREFKSLSSLFEELKTDAMSGVDYFTEISMGMSGDWEIAVEEGATMIRIGSLLFGARN